MNKAKVAIIGAGNGGHAIAGHLGMQGFPIRLYNKFEQEITHIREHGGVTVEGVVQGFGPVELTTTDPEPVIGWADVIMVVVPAFAHRFVAETCAPYLRDGQTILLNPGRTGGALEFAKVLQEQSVTAKVHIAEAQSLIYACRVSGPARARINGIKQALGLAAFPSAETSAVLEMVNPLYPQFYAADSVLDISFDNIGAVFHPSAVVLNATAIEAGQADEFYGGMTPSVVQFMEVIDRERLAVASAYGIEIDSAREWLLKTYTGVTGNTLYECLQSNKAYVGIKAPKSLKVRHIIEDIPTGLVPIAGLGELAGVPTPACRAIIDIGGILVGRDFWTEGRTVEKLGLSGLTVEQVREFVHTGAL